MLAERKVTANALMSGFPLLPREGEQSSRSPRPGHRASSRPISGHPVPALPPREGTSQRQHHRAGRGQPQSESSPEQREGCTLRVCLPQII